MIVTVNLVGVTAPALPRQMTLALGEGATLRALVEEVARQGGEALRRSLWAPDGSLERSVVIAVGGEVVDSASLDAQLPMTAAAEVFLIRPIFGGA